MGFFVGGFGLGYGVVTPIMGLVPALCPCCTTTPLLSCHCEGMCRVCEVETPCFFTSPSEDATAKTCDQQHSFICLPPPLPPPLSVPACA